MGYPPPINGPAPTFPFGPDDDLAGYEEGLAAAMAAETAAANAASATAKQSGQQAYNQSLANSATANAPLIAAANAANAEAAALTLAALAVPTTIIAPGSNGDTLPQTSIFVSSTSGFPVPGSFTVDGSTVSYTGTSGSEFTGCTGGTALLSTGDLVTASPNVAAQAAAAAAQTLARELNAAVSAAQSSAAQAANAAAAAASATPSAPSSSGLSALCSIFERGLSVNFGGGGVGAGGNISTPAETLSAGASAGVSATCCGFSLNLSFGFSIDFQLPSFDFTALLQLLIPYLGFSLNCDPTGPINLVVGVPYGGGRVSNAEPDPDDDENNC